MNRETWEIGKIWVVKNDLYKWYFESISASQKRAVFEISDIDGKINWRTIPDYAFEMSIANENRVEVHSDDLRFVAKVMSRAYEDCYHVQAIARGLSQE